MGISRPCSKAVDVIFMVIASRRPAWSVPNVTRVSRRSRLRARYDFCRPDNAERNERGCTGARESSSDPGVGSAIKQHRGSRDVGYDDTPHDRRRETPALPAEQAVSGGEAENAVEKHACG